MRHLITSYNSETGRFNDAAICGAATIPIRPDPAHAPMIVYTESWRDRTMYPSHVTCPACRAIMAARATATDRAMERIADLDAREVSR